MPADSPKRTTFFEALERGRHFLEFANFETARLAALRDILLVQTFLADANMAALATVRASLDPRRGNALADPHLGPLVEQIDQQLLQSHNVAANAPDQANDGEHFGPASQEAIAAELFQRAVATGLLGILARRTSVRPHQTESNETG